MTKPKKVPKPLCKGCNSRPAKWPKHNPRFCTQRCAADWAHAMSEGEDWKPFLREKPEGEWYWA